MARAAVAATSVPAPASAPPAPAPAPAPEPEAPAAQPPVATSSAPADLFDTAFSEAVAAEAEPTPSSPASAAVPKKPAEPKSAPAEPKPASVPAEPPAPAEPTPQPLAPAEPAPQPQPQPPTPQPTPQPQPPTPQPQPQAYQEPPLFNANEVTQLQAFYTDWPDVAQATETMIRGIMTQTTRQMYAHMAASLAPYLQTINTLADKTQLSELQNSVSDYDAVSTQLTSWAARQPAYLRSAYEHVIKSGTAAEVVDLINRYKQDMQLSTPVQGVQGSQPAPAAPAPAPSAPSPPINPALAAAAARLAPVSTKRTSVVAAPTDFDTAFAEFAKAS